MKWNNLFLIYLSLAFVVVITAILCTGCSAQTKHQEILIHTEKYESFYDPYRTISFLCSNDYYTIKELSNNGIIVEYECTSETEKIYVGYNHEKRIAVITLD